MKVILSVEQKCGAGCLKRDSESEGTGLGTEGHQPQGGREVYLDPAGTDTQSTMAARPLLSWSRVLGYHEAVFWLKEPQAHRDVSPSDTRQRC